MGHFRGRLSIASRHGARAAQRVFLQLFACVPTGHSGSACAPRALWTVEWVDTSAADGVKGYELTCREQAGGVCKGAEFKTAGFTLKAPEVELAETGNEVRITILSKVAR